MEKPFVNKALFEDLSTYIFAVIGTFKPNMFPQKTMEAVTALKNYIDNTFNREAVRVGSGEHNAGIDFSQDLARYLSDQILQTKNLVEGRKKFVIHVNRFTNTFLQMENHPIHNWLEFKKLLRLIP